MAFFNIDPNITKNPPEKTRIKSIKVKPYEDGKRILVSLELTPFTVRPLIELKIMDSEGNICGDAVIVEPPFWKQELTMHVKDTATKGIYFHLEVSLIYANLPNHAKKRKKFIFP
jgi:hypothetical protein